MKKLLLSALFICAFSLRTRAGDTDLEIHCTAKRVDQNTQTAAAGGANQTTEHWTYELSIENKTFKELTNLQVRYAIFLTREKLGEKAGQAPDQKKGSFTIDAFKPHEKRTFTTETVELKKSNLVGGWTYPSGAKPNAQDTLVGLALRVYQNGQVFLQFANPSNLSREKWE